MFFANIDSTFMSKIAIDISNVSAFEDSLLLSIQYLNQNHSLLLNTFLCGLSYYLYNELQNKILSRLGAVPTAVGNAFKRVVVFVAFYLVLNEPFPAGKAWGCVMAVVGCLAFAISEAYGV